MEKETGKLRAGTATVKACTGGAGHGCGRGRWLRASLWGQGTAATGLELRARLGGGECKVAFWLTPSPAYIEPTWAAEGSFGTLRWFSEFGLLAFLHFKNFNLLVNI